MKKPTYKQAKAESDRLLKEYHDSLDYARSLHDHKWEQRVTWAQYCDGCGDTRLVKGPVDKRWEPDDDELQRIYREHLEG